MGMASTLAWLVLGWTTPMTGTVVDAEGRPVAGASVWLGDTFAKRAGPDLLASAETDEAGRFRLDREDDLAGRGTSWSPALWAYKPGLHVASVEFKNRIPGPDEPVKLVLGPATAATVRVVGADGRPAAGARVRVGRLNLATPSPPSKLFGRLARTADAEGEVPIDGFALDEVAAVDVVVDGQIAQFLPLDVETRSIALRPLGRLQVRVTADDPKAVVGWAITASPRPTEPGYKGPYTTQWARETTGADGLAIFPPLAEGQVVWEVRSPRNSRYLVEKLPDATIRAGQKAEVAIAIRAGVMVEGQLREDPDGSPIPGVKIDVAPLRSGSRTVRDLTTDAQGRYSTAVLPGPVRFSFSAFAMPPTYFLPPGVQTWVDFDVKDGEGRHEFDPPRLRKAASVRGLVVDEAGQPVPGAQVHGSWSAPEFTQRGNTATATADARGEFVLGSIAPRAEVRVSTSRGQVAGSDAVVVFEAGEGGPVRLVLRKKPTLALGGRVLDGDGRPLAGATVRVQVRPPNQPMMQQNAPFAFEGGQEVRTDADGRFRTPDQVPTRHDYQVDVRAPGFDPATSRWLVGPATEFPDLRARRSVGRREVVGRAVDADGKPVAGVEVFQAGDGPRTLRSVTDADGRYRLPGMPATAALLFARRDGYRFAGRAVGAGEGEGDFALRRLDQPPAAPLRPADPGVPRAEERAIGLALADAARKGPETDFELVDRQQIPGIIAMLDPDRAIAMIENQIFRAGQVPYLPLAIGQYERDPRLAIEVLDSIGEPAEVARVALDLSARLGSWAPPGFHRELLDRAARSARATTNPAGAAGLLARIAIARFDSGDRDEAARLVREAQALAEKPAEPNFQDPFLNLAPALARVDPAAALRLVEAQAGAKPRDQMRDYAGASIARQLAATDPDGARRLIAQLDQDWSRIQARREICCELAVHDLPAARSWAAEDHDPFVQAILPAIAARARAEADPVAARALLLEAVEGLARLDVDDYQQSARNPPPSLALMRLVPLAARIDPDRAPGYFWLALARRAPLALAIEPKPIMPWHRQHYLDLAELAVLAARYDREAAAVVFAPAADRLVGLHDEYWGLGGEGPPLFKAAGAFDARVARTLLEALPDDPAPPTGPARSLPRNQNHAKAQARIALAEILGLPPALRWGAAIRFGVGPSGWPDALDD